MNKLIRSLKKLLPERGRLHTAVATAFLLGITACELNPDKEIDPNPNQHLQTTSSQNSTYDTDADTVETATTLAYKLTNPYTVPNMRQAYQNMYGGSGNHIVATHQYVRFKPANTDQLLTLIETLDLELYDTPLDYKIAYEGDYYQDPSIPDEEITWQYTVVPVNFTFPSGIQYELLSSIHIPSDEFDLMEAEAERLAGLNADGDDYAFSSTSSISSMDDSSLNDGPTCPECETPLCAPGFMWDPNTGSCVPDTRCPSGFVWDDAAGGCVSINPPKPSRGRILVRDTRLGDEGVQKVRVVAKRWFKIERMYTDNTGYFNSTKNFRNSVKLVVKFKNSDATIRGMRGARFWQILYPVQRKFGPFKGSQINNFRYTFEINNNYSSKGTRYWAAATTHNAVQQFKMYSTQEGTGSLPNGSLKILLTNWAWLSGKGSAPLFAARQINNIDHTFLTTFVASTVSPAAGKLALIAEVLKSQLDITYSYNVDENTLTSDRIVETIYHELAHATLYKQAGNDWYVAVVNGTIAEILSSGPSPYGAGNTSNSGIIAVNEGWANHYGKVLTDRRYGNNTDCTSSQRTGAVVCSTNFIGFSRIRSENPYLEALERFVPNLDGDPFGWIPKGIFLDLIDDTPDELAWIGTVDDQVSGFTNSQLFQAINSDTRSPQTYRDRLLQQNGNAQITQINFLFAQYGYQ